MLKTEAISPEMTKIATSKFQTHYFEFRLEKFNQIQHVCLKKNSAEMSFGNK